MERHLHLPSCCAALATLLLAAVLITSRWWYLSYSAGSMQCAVGAGLVRVCIYDHQTDAHKGWRLCRIERLFWWFRWWEGYTDMGDGTSARSHALSIPIWLLLICSIVLACCLILRRRGPKVGMCATCGYDLTGNTSGTCPECGAHATKDKGDILFS